MWLDQQRRETLQSVERDASGRRIRGITPTVAQPEAKAPQPGFGGRAWFSGRNLSELFNHSSTITDSVINARLLAHFTPNPCEMPLSKTPPHHQSDRFPEPSRAETAKPTLRTRC